MKKLKYVVNLRNVKTRDETDLPYLGLENIESKTGKIIKNTSNNDDDFNESLANIFYEGDVVFSKLRPYLAKCTVVDFNGKGTNELLVLHAKPKEVINSYLAYTMLTNAFTDLVDSSTYGSKMPRANWSFIGSQLIPLPDLREQTQIANFLNQKTTEIDSLISDKETMISLLKEQRQAMITEAVTKGLNPEVKMKESELDGIGVIPEHWRIGKIKYEFNNLDYKRIPLSSEERGLMENKKYDYYGASGVIDLVEDYIFDDTLILIGEDGANLYSRNSPLAYMASGKFWVNNHAHILKPKNGDINYFVNLLESLDYTIYISGSAQPKLTQEKLGSIQIPVPPKKEQEQIAEYIVEKDDDFKSLIHILNQQVSKLKEYRQSLIYEAVIGKIDVRNYSTSEVEVEI
ncbi:hypothetical protein BSK63_22190 [Paenibacillus odorifer]|nr:hypothetical protein BSK63_22190 [Paenibacillus odorifer]OME34912.1 hypothetical protein BSK46_20225 [Paenibacillus odorifer]